VFASGPTGPIINKQFMGRSDQPLRLFVVDIGTGTLVKTINTGIDAAFSGSLSNGAIDTDRSKPYSTGFYSDDAFYVGYTKQTDSTNWHYGGVGRVLTKESTDPTTWTFSKVYEGTDVGPVTSAVTKLQDRGNRNLWIYFGTGRYFFKNATTIDDSDNQRRIYGIKDPCYDSNANDITQTCTATVLATSSLQDQTTLGVFDPAKQGWYINLEPANSTTMVSAERVITDPIASPSGAVFYTTFQPNADVCSYGGGAYIWAVNYATGGAPSPRSMMGKLLMQVSTGAFAEANMATAFTGKDGRRTGASVQGVPPKAQGLSLLTNPKPVKKIMHILEK
jgi:type IV pilus assembly protein PilY1